MTGGYKIIDLYGLDLATMQLDSTKIEKIFNDIESTYKTKALLFDNYKINGIEQNATFSSAVVKNSGFEITLGDYKLLIKNNSVVDSTLHLYMHNISISFDNEVNDNQYISLTLYNITATGFNVSTLYDYMNNKGTFMCTSCVNSLPLLQTSGQSLIFSISAGNNSFTLNEIDDNNGYNKAIENIRIEQETITKIF